MSDEKISDGFVDAVRELVEAVVYKECTCAGGDYQDAAMDDVNAALEAVLHECRAMPEYSPLHLWGDFVEFVQTSEAEMEQPDGTWGTEPFLVAAKHRYDAGKQRMREIADEVQTNTD